MLILTVTDYYIQILMTTLFSMALLQTVWVVNT